MTSARKSITKTAMHARPLGDKLQALGLSLRTDVRQAVCLFFAPLTAIRSVAGASMRTLKSMDHTMTPGGHPES